MTASKQLESASLYFTSGGSDKEYHARIEAEGDAFVVNVEYGRRGGTLSTGTKTRTPVDYAAALKIFETLVAAKTSKGYSRGEDGTPYLHSIAEKQASGLLPMLLNSIDEAAANRAAEDPAWIMQEKLDGRRLMLRRVADTVEGINKLGLIVSLSTAVADSARELPGDFTLDGEVVGDTYHVFDLISLNGSDLRRMPCGDRYRELTALIDSVDPSKHLGYVATWGDAAGKAAQLNAFRSSGAEGVVFKHVDAVYAPGRPNSGGMALKFKFVETVSAVVTGINRQRSVGVSLLNRDGDWQAVGNVTIPANHAVPKLGDVVEVRYLYAAPGGALYQPVYLGVRDDINNAECVLGQMKFKTEE